MNLFIFRIFFFKSFPYILLGILLKSKIIIRSEINIIYLITIFLFGAFLSIKEACIFGKDYSSYIGTNIELLSLILLSKYNKKNNNSILNVISYLGRQLSGNLYIYHIAIGQIIDFISIKKGINKFIFYYYIRYFAICFFSIIFAL